MKLLIILLALSLVLSSCNKPLTVEGITYEPVGALQLMLHKEDKCVTYDFNVASIVLGAFTFASIVGPVVFWGFLALDPVAVDHRCVSARSKL